jgi:hypothetical protein
MINSPKLYRNRLSLQNLLKGAQGEKTEKINVVKLSELNNSEY